MRYLAKHRCFSILLVLVCWFMSTGAEASGLQRHHLTGFAQGTSYAVTYFADSECIGKASIDSVLAVLDSSMSLYKPYSLINRVNRAERRVLINDPHFRQVFRRSEELYRQSGGLFDITVAPLVALWGFGVEARDALPDDEAVADALECVGMDKVTLDDQYLVKEKPCIQLDMNGIAQGYSVDVLAGFLEGQGIQYYVVELGGELRVKGPKPDGTPFRIGIERPLVGEGGATVIEDVIAITTGALTTAGSYRKFVDDGDRRLSHHIDPRTGKPVTSSTISATLYSTDAMTADGYDNVIMAMPAKDALAFVESLDELEVYIVYQDESGSLQEIMSTGFKQLMAN